MLCWYSGNLWPRSLNCAVINVPMVAIRMNARATTATTDGTRLHPQCRNRVTNGANKNETSTASATGTKISRAKYNTATTITTLSRVVLRETEFGRFVATLLIKITAAAKRFHVVEYPKG